MESAAAPQASLEEHSSSNTDDAAEVRALSRALNRSSGFTLLFACCNDSTRREELTRELSAAKRAGTGGPRTIFLRKGENVLNLAATLREQLATSPKPGAVFVDGLENVLPQARDAGNSAFVANLNAYRNALPGTVPVPLVLWVTEWLLGVVARHAPDFFSVKSGVYFFSEESHAGTRRVERALNAEPRLGWENVPHEELRARAEEIRASLDAPRTSFGGDSLLEARLAFRLGNIYLTLYQIDDAEALYSRSRKLFEKFSLEAATQEIVIEHDLAAIYHQSGRIAEERRDFAAAEDWYRKSLAISERQGNERGAANAYHQLGRIAEERRDFAAAEDWYRKSLAIKERQGNEHGAAITYHQLGKIAGLQHDFENAGRWMLKCIVGFVRAKDERLVQHATANFLYLHEQATVPERVKLKVMWEAANIGPFPTGSEESSDGST